jgi:hypothetical protein
MAWYADAFNPRLLPLIAADQRTGMGIASARPEHVTGGHAARENIPKNGQPHPDRHMGRLIRSVQNKGISSWYGIQARTR